MGRKLILCLDGTANEMRGNSTNVFRVAKGLEAREDQVIYYSTGVGTVDQSMHLTGLVKFIFRWMDRSVGISLRQQVLDAVQFLVETYQEGDEVYIFGFSRGAYAGRAVAGFLQEFGLPRVSSKNLLPYLWQVYSENDIKAEEKPEYFVNKARIKKYFGRKVEIEFLGIWDTVSAFGVIQKMRTLPYTRQLPNVKRVCHAVALDERRSAYRYQTLHDENPNHQQVFFPGFHSDVGGSTEADGIGVGAWDLEWVFAASGLAMVEPSRYQPKGPVESKDLNPSMGLVFGIMELIPFRRWNRDSKSFKLTAPNLWRPRWISEKAEFHESAWHIPGYHPPQWKGTPEEWQEIKPSGPGPTFSVKL